MAAYTRSLTSQLDMSAVLRWLLASALVLLIVAGAAWWALTPTTVTATSGSIANKWVEAGTRGQPAQYWVEVRDGRTTQRCAVAAYQSQLLAEWENLSVGDSASLTCYGPGAVSLTRLP